MGTGGDVFVLDMGQPVRIDELARRMIKLPGLTVRDDKNPDGDIEIEYSGLRPGEKLFEELLIGRNVTGTEHPMIMRAIEPSPTWDEARELLAELDDRREPYRLPPRDGRSREGPCVEYRSAPVIHDLVFGQRGSAPSCRSRPTRRVTVLSTDSARRSNLPAKPEPPPENCLTVGASGALP